MRPERILEKTPLGSQGHLLLSSRDIRHAGSNLITREIVIGITRSSSRAVDHFTIRERGKLLKVRNTSPSVLLNKWTVKGQAYSMSR